MRGAIILAAIILKDTIHPLTTAEGKLLGIILGLMFVWDLTKDFIIKKEK